MAKKRYNYTPAELELLKTLLEIRIMPRNFNMVVDRVLHRMSLSDTAKKYKVSSSWVNAVEVRVFNEIRRTLKIAVRERLKAMDRVGRFRESEYQRIKTIE